MKSKTVVRKLLAFLVVFTMVFSTMMVMATADDDALLVDEAGQEEVIEQDDFNEPEDEIVEDDFDEDDFDTDDILMQTSIDVFFAPFSTEFEYILYEGPAASMTNWEPFLFPKECLDIEDFEYSEIHYAYSEDGLKSFFGDHTHLVVEYDSVTILGWGALNFAIVDPTDDDLPQINLSASEYDGINPSPLVNKPSAGPGTFPGGTIKLELSRVLAALVYPAGEGLIWSDELQTNIPRPYDAYNNPEGIDLGLIFNWGVGEIEVTKIYLEGGTKENPPEEPEPPVEPGDVLVTGIIFDDTDTDTNKKVVDELEIGETIQLSVIVLPEDAENKEVKWYSDRALVASVDDTGLVTGISDGFGVTITARTTDGGFLADCFIIQVGEGGEEPEPTPTPRPRYYDVNATEPDGSPVRNEIISWECLPYSYNVI
jgi:hypothetical protein